MGKSRITLALIVEEYESGMTPEDMVRAYDTLDLADVYAVVAYYLRHRDVVGLAGMVAIGLAAAWLVATFPSPGALALIAVAGIGLFALFVSLMVAAVRGAVGETQIVVTESRLRVEFTGPFHPRAKTWRQGELACFHPDALGLWFLGQQERWLFAGRQRDELVWLACTLGDAWQLPSEEPLGPNELNVFITSEDDGDDGLQYYKFLSPEECTPEGGVPARLRHDSDGITLRLLRSRWCRIRLLKPGRRTLRELLRAGEAFRPRAGELKWTEWRGRRVFEYAQHRGPNRLLLRVWTDDMERLEKIVECLWPEIAHEMATDRENASRTL